MPDPERFSGLFVPVTSPFDRMTGEIAPVAFRENLRRWVDAPIDGYVLFGSNGEGVLLDLEEKLRLIGFARDLVPPARPLVAGAGADSTRGTVAEIRRLAEAGADAVMVHPPPYFGATLSPDALRDHYVAVAETVPVPVLVYHIPKYTHVVMEAGFIAAVARHPNIVGLKDSSGDLRRLAAYTEVCDDGCRLLVGNGALFYPALELGAAGGVLAIALLDPEGCAAVRYAYRRGESRAAGEVQERLARVHEGVVARFGVPGVKAALDLLGLNGGGPRPPLRPLRERDRAHVARVLQDAGVAPLD